MSAGMPRTDKRVYDIRAKSRSDDRWVVLAISADTTLVDLHVALLGAFEWSGSYADAEPRYCFVVGAQRFQRGKGSRTALRRLLSMGVGFEYGCDLARFVADCSIVKEYAVSSRRHYPKVVDAHPSIQAQDATWRAQDAVRRYYRAHELKQRRETPKRRLAGPRDPHSAYAHGFFSALVAGPAVMPTSWLQRFISTEHESLEELNASAQRVMNAYNEVADRLLREREWFGEMTLEIARRDVRGNALIEWQRGFLEAMELDPDGWRTFLSRIAGKDLLQPLAIISQCAAQPSKRDWLADQDLRENLGRSIGVMTVRLWEAYREQPFKKVLLDDAAERRQEPKVSRNDPCPCGSGKKYKRCCGASLRAI
jgi:uncharacterized protein